MSDERTRHGTIGEGSAKVFLFIAMIVLPVDFIQVALILTGRGL